MSSVVEPQPAAVLGLRRERQLPQNGMRESAQSLLGLVGVLRELVELASGAEDEPDPVSDAIRDYKRSTPPGQQELLTGALKVFALGLLTAVGPGDAPDERITKDLELLKAGRLELPEGLAIRQEGRSFELRVTDPSVAAVLVNVLSGRIWAARRPKRQEVMTDSLLATVVGGFEAHMRKVFATILSINPALVEASDHAFTLAELQKFASIDDARSSLTEKKIDQLISDGVDAWAKRMAKPDVGISLQEASGDWPIVREGYARRNLIVHNDRIVNRRYLAIVRDLALPWEHPEEGEVAAVSAEYLYSFADRLLASAVNIALQVEARLLKTDHSVVVSWILELHEEMLRQRINQAVITTAESALKGLKIKRATEVRMRINRWIAMRDIGRQKEVNAEVAKWDTSGLSADLANARNVLVGDAEVAISEIRRQLQLGLINLGELLTNPLYRDLVSGDAIQEILEGGGESEAVAKIELDEVLPGLDEGVEQ